MTSLLFNIKCIFFGVFITMSAYHLFIYLGRRVDKRNLAYFFYGLSISIMLFVLQIVYPIKKFNYNYVAFPIALSVAFSASYFLDTVFRPKALKLFSIIVKAAYGTLSLCLFVSYIINTNYFNRVLFNIFSLLYLIVYTIIITVEVIKYQHYKDKIKFWVLMGFVPVFLSIVYICLLHTREQFANERSNISLFLPQYLGYLGMMITFAYALGIQYRRDHDSVIKLNKKLTDINASLEDEIARRTKEIEQEKIKRAAVEYELGKREREVLLLLFNGLTNNQIGVTLFISESTVKTYVKRIYQKIEAKNKLDLFKKIKLL